MIYGNCVKEAHDLFQFIGKVPMKKKYWIYILIVIVAVGGYFIYSNNKNAQAAANAGYQTVAVERGSLTAIVGATGSVYSNQTATLSWQTSGQIESIDVKLDDEVQKDAVLARLVRTSLPQSVILAEADLVNAQRALADLKESNLASAQAYSALANAKDALETAQTQRASKQYKRASTDTVDAARADYYLAEDKVKKAQEIFDVFASKPENDPQRAAALSSLASAKQIRDQKLHNLQYLESAPDAVEIDIADANLAVAQAQYEDALREYNRLKDGADPNDIAAAEAKVASIEATLATAELKAPFAGTVTEINSKVGDKVNNGTVSFRIDDLSHLLVDVQVPEVDINRIKVGQEASIFFDAILNKEYKGVVTEVGRVGNNVNGVVNFNVTLELLDADAEVLPGMTAAVNMVVSQIDDVLMVPNRAIRQVNGQYMVYILKNGISNPVTIKIGSTSDTMSEILDGDIKKGDLVILNPSISFEDMASGRQMFGN